jgi:hypothetical protein
LRGASIQLSLQCARRLCKTIQDWREFKAGSRIELANRRAAVIGGRVWGDKRQPILQVYSVIVRSGQVHTRTWDACRYPRPALLTATDVKFALSFDEDADHGCRVSNPIHSRAAWRKLAGRRSLAALARLVNSMCSRTKLLRARMASAKERPSQRSRHHEAIPDLTASLCAADVHELMYVVESRTQLDSFALPRRGSLCAAVQFSVRRAMRLNTTKHSKGGARRDWTSHVPSMVALNL